MKINQWTMGLAAVGVVSLASAVQAEESMNAVQTALSGVTISGYVDTSLEWDNGDDYSAFGGSIPLKKQVDDERKRERNRPKQRRPVPLWVKQSAFDAALARVAQVALVVENVIHAIHKQVVRNQKEQGTDEQIQIEAAGCEEVGGREWKRGIDPRDWTR